MILPAVHTAWPYGFGWLVPMAPRSLFDPMVYVYVPIEVLG